jgi:hypothetical protein
LSSPPLFFRHNQGERGEAEAEQEQEREVAAGRGEVELWRRVGGGDDCRGSDERRRENT